MSRGVTKTPKDSCLDWIYERKANIETAKYGKNKKSVSDALASHEEQARQIGSYRQEVQSAKQASGGAAGEQLNESYDGLKDTLEKKLNCLKTMMEIVSLEDSCGSLSAEFDAKAFQLVSADERRKAAPLNDSNQIPGFVSPSSQDCIFAARDNWNWIITLVDCIKVHLSNAADYHQFFHEIEESSQWLLEDLRRVVNSFDVSKFKGDYDDAKRLLKELEEMTRALRQWDAKTQHMWERAVKVVPVNLRTEGVTVETPCRAIAEYETKEIHIRPGEDLLVLDNSRATMWKVRNGRGQEAEVPALCILIPGPAPGALEAAVRLRLQLMAVWTNALKRIGKRLLCFMLLVFKPVYNEEEINLLRETENIQKADLLRILDYIEDSLERHWSEHEGFIALQERLLALRMILEEAWKNPNEDQNVYSALVVQVKMLEELMRKYRDLWEEWEKHKMALESSRSPELMLIVDKWEQLQFVSKAYMAKFWQTELSFDDLERSLASLQGMVEDGVDGLQESEEEVATQAVQTANLHMAKIEPLEAHSHGFGEMTETTEVMEEVQKTKAVSLARAQSVVEETDFGVAHETRTAETEQLSSAEMEEKKTFLIRSVVDPRTGMEVSMNDAVMAGIIKPEEGLYNNLATGETMPIPMAMTAGLIKVAFTTTKRSQEKRSTIGIITINTTREKVRPYSIESVRDVAAATDLDHRTASKKGIIDARQGVFKDTSTGRQMLISDAIDAGLVSVTYGGAESEPETVTKTYAVRAVVDRRHKTTVNFHEAVRRGILNKETGAFRDTLTGDTMYVGDAIMRGFLKARQIDDPHSLNIDPENRLFIDKTDIIRRKLLQPLGVISAFRRAAKMAKHGKDKKGSPE